MDSHIKKLKILTPNYWVCRLLNLSVFRILIFTFIFLYLFSNTTDFFYQIGFRGHSSGSHIPENMEWMSSEFGDPKGFNKSHNPPSNIFKLVFCLFVALGCSIQLDAVLDFSDALVFLICVPNIIGLYMLAPMVRKELRSYNKKYIKRH